ncbi:MAG: ABC transporter permease, partial [[Mycobacterium] stephanolepidis]
MEFAPTQGVKAPAGSVATIEDWAVGYVRRHPLAAVTTVGEQFV